MDVTLSKDDKLLLIAIALVSNFTQLKGIKPGVGDSIAWGIMGGFAGLPIYAFG
jgi:hypothetical protein